MPAAVVVGGLLCLALGGGAGRASRLVLVGWRPLLLARAGALAALMVDAPSSLLLLPGHPCVCVWIGWSEGSVALAAGFTWRRMKPHAAATNREGEHEHAPCPYKCWGAKTGHASATAKRDKVQKDPGQPERRRGLGKWPGQRGGCCCVQWRSSWLEGRDKK